MTNRSLRRLGAAVLGLAVLAVTAAPATAQTAGAGSPAVPAAHTGAAVPAPTAGLAAAGLAGAYFVSNNGGKCLVSAGNGDGGARRGRAPGPDSRSSQRRLRRKLQRTGVRLSELG